MWGAIASVAGPVLGGLLGSDGSSQASNGSSEAARAATAQQAAQYAQTRDDLSPFRNTGALANARLATYLGLGSERGGGGGGEPYSSIRSRLLPQYTTIIPGRGARLEGGQGNSDNSDRMGGTFYPSEPATTSIDEGRLNAAIQEIIARNEAAQPAENSPNYGSLLRNFTGADLQNEPGYQFGMSEGNKGIDRASAARGGYDSGATLKALTRFNQDYAGTKFNDAFSRDAQNKQRTYGFLSGTAGAGQNAAAQTATSGANAANAIGGYGMQNASNQGMYGMMGAANLSNGINAGIGNYLYQQRQQPANASLAGFQPGDSWY